MDAKKWLAAAALLAAGPVAATDPAASGAESPARLYTTPQERRDAGIKHAVFSDRLTVAGLIELEDVHQRFALAAAAPRSRDQQFSGSLQMGLETKPASWLHGELLGEVERASSGRERFLLNEMFVEGTVGEVQVDLGRFFLPFGEYYSHFASGPLLEFGETRGRVAAALGYAPVQPLDLSAFAYRGRADKIDGGGHGWDWGLAAQFEASKNVVLGLGYLSDLADSQAALLADASDNRYAARVAAWNAHAAWRCSGFEVTAEWLGALNAFSELAPDRNRPRAWNLELAVGDEFRFALRAEGSRELEGAPREQVGAALSWRIGRRASITIEYLFGRYAAGLAEDSVGHALERVQHFGGQFSLSL